MLCLRVCKEIKPDSKDAKKKGVGRTWADISVQEKSCPSVCQDVPGSVPGMKEPVNPLIHLRRAVGSLMADLERFL